MTIETENYPTRTIMETAKTIRNSNGWRSLHTDFINNKESDGYHVTFVNGSDDPHNSPEAITERETKKIERDRTQKLKEKLKNRTISQPELLELLENFL